MHHSVTFNYGSGKVCSPTIFETSFSYNKDIWILQLINFTASLFKFTDTCCHLAIEFSCFNTLSLHTFSLLKHYLNLYITDSESIPIFVLFHDFYISW